MRLDLKSAESQNFLQIQNLHRNYFDGCFTSFANPADCDCAKANRLRLKRKILPFRFFCEILQRTIKKLLLLFAFAKSRISPPFRLKSTSDSTIPQNLPHRFYGIAESHTKCESLPHSVILSVAKYPQKINKSFCSVLLIQKVGYFLSLAKYEKNREQTLPEFDENK